MGNQYRPTQWSDGAAFSCAAAVRVRRIAKDYTDAWKQAGELFIQSKLQKYKLSPKNVLTEVGDTT